VADALRHLASALDAMLARILGGKLHPDQLRCDDRIAVTRFAQNGASHALRRALAPLIMKIFSLPKVATQSPRSAFARRSRDRQDASLQRSRAMQACKKILAA